MKPTSNLFNQLNKYALDDNNLQQLLIHSYYPKKTNIQNKIQPKKEDKSKKNEDFFIPDEKDSIFWCWFIFKYGFSEYEILKKNTFTTEKEYKINFIEKVRKGKHILKKLKMKLTDIEGNLSSEPNLSIKSLESMLIIEEYNFTYMNDKIFYENLIKPEHKNCIIKYFPNKDKCGLFLDKDKLFEYRNKLFVVDNISKPIKGISNYKAQELKDICKKLNIDIMKTPTKTKTKKELYQLVIEKII
jgi:hypothetical protein